MACLLVVFVRDNRFNTTLFQIATDSSATVTLVPRQAFRTALGAPTLLPDMNFPQHRFQLLRIMDLTGRHDDFQRRPVAVDTKVDFTAKSAAGSA
jgi:hypothetical protein